MNNFWKGQSNQNLNFWLARLSYLDITWNAGLISSIFIFSIGNCSVEWSRTVFTLTDPPIVHRAIWQTGIHCARISQIGSWPHNKGLFTYHVSQFCGFLVSNLRPPSLASQILFRLLQKNCKSNKACFLLRCLGTNQRQMLFCVIIFSSSRSNNCKWQMRTLRSACSMVAGG